MNLSRWVAIPALAACLVASSAQAQQAMPRVGYVSPAGGRQGTTFEVMVGGQYLDGVTRAFVSGDGVDAKVVDYFKPVMRGQFSSLRGKLQQLLQKKSAPPQPVARRGAQDGSQTSTNVVLKTAWTAADERSLADVRRKLGILLRGQLPVPAIGETVALEITMAPDAEPGKREVRLETPKGLTNPLAFWVGQLAEYSKEVTNINEEVIFDKQFKFQEDQKASTPTPPIAITLPATVNGQIMPGGLDRFQFTARKGQRLVVVANAREVIPYIPDAVPGWFQATLALFDANGKELAYADHYRFHPDPVLFVEIPDDGQYTVAIRDSIYRGREDFVYRVTIGELPFLTGIFPLGGPAGAPTTLALQGWNLPSATLTMDGRDKPPGIYRLTVNKDGRESNVAPFALDTLPECLEQEPNNQVDHAQRIALPAIVNGRIDPPGDADVFQFEGRAGGEIVAEVLARRLNSPLDSSLRLTDAAGKQLAFNDDLPDKGSGLSTHHADSQLRATLPKDGVYYLHLTDAQHKGGPEYAYRLRISAPRPDFDLRIVPSNINVRGNASVPLTVHALRKDGFAGEIALVLKDPPLGFELGGGSIPAGQDQAKVTLKIPPLPQEAPLSLSMEGRATIEGREVVHPAVPADDMMQAFEYRHLVPSRELKVDVAGRSATKPSVRVVGRTPVKIPSGGTIPLRVAVMPRFFVGKVRFELTESPDGLTIKSLAPSRDGADLVLECDAAKIKPGLKGTLAVAAFPEKPGDSGKTKSSAAPSRNPLATSAAIPFEIVPQ